MKRQEWRVLIGGHGGQGIVLMSYVLAQLGMESGYEVTWFPSYGAEMRGGTATGSVIISPDPIPSPILLEPTHAVVLNLPSYLKFYSRLGKEGILVYNSSMVPERQEKEGGPRQYGVPGSELAEREGNPKVTNMVMLGAFLGESGLASLDAAERAIAAILPERHAKLLPLNLRAIERGMEHIQRLKGNNRDH